LVSDATAGAASAFTCANSAEATIHYRSISPGSCPYVWHLKRRLRADRLTGKHPATVDVIVASVTRPRLARTVANADATAIWNERKSRAGGQKVRRRKEEGWRFVVVSPWNASAPKQCDLNHFLRPDLAPICPYQLFLQFRLLFPFGR